MRNFLLGAVALGTLATAALVQTAPAQAYTLRNGNPAWYFTNIGSEDKVGDSLVNGFMVSVENEGSTALFRFFNDLPAGNTASIGQVAIDYIGSGTNPLGPNFAFISSLSSAGVNFVDNSPQTLPQFNDEYGSFNLSARFDNGNGNGNGNGKGNGNGNGNNQNFNPRINVGEFGAFRVGYTGTFENLLASFEKHDLIAGIHVQEIGNQGASDSYTTIPTPALLPGLIGLGVGAFRKRKQQEAAE